MFRGQDQDGYIETKTAGVYSCNKVSTMYPGATSKLQIARLTDQVAFRQNDAALAPITTNLPSGLLPVRFSAYTFTQPPTTPIDIKIDYVFVKHNERGPSAAGASGSCPRLRRSGARNARNVMSSTQLAR